MIKIYKSVLDIVDRTTTTNLLLALNASNHEQVYHIKLGQTTRNIILKYTLNFVYSCLILYLFVSLTNILASNKQ